MTPPVPFGMVIPSVYGPVIVNRFDTIQAVALLKTGCSSTHNELAVLCGFLKSAPSGTTVLDAGANIGLYALAFARELLPKNGRVHAFEAQRIFAYMVGGSAALNGLENLYIHHKAVGGESTKIPIPQFDYNQLSSFGSVEFGREQKEFIGQPRHFRLEREDYVDVIRLDDHNYHNVHLLKVDVEGMEEAALSGATQIIERDKPVLYVEWVKASKERLVSFCKERGYRVFEWGMNLLCIHRDKFTTYNVNVQLPEL